MGLFNELFSLDTWFLENLTTGQILTGQFPPLSVTEDLSNNYAEQKSLNRQNPIIQFLSGNADKTSFSARMYARDATANYKLLDQLNMLKSWMKIDKNLGHPPVLSFWVGDEHVAMTSCIANGISGITYEKPTILGALRGVTFTMNLTFYEPFDIEDVGNFETRYHRSKVFEYFEMLCYNEYQNPILGDIIRKRHPTKQILNLGTVVKLPSIDGIRKDQVTQTSEIFKTSFGRRETPQRALRLAMLGKRNRAYVSNVL